MTPQCENPELISLPLPYLSPMRRLGALLRADALAAASQGDGKRTVDNLQAALTLSRFPSETPFLISALVSVYMAEGACRTTGSVLQRWPEALGDSQWSALAHSLAAFALEDVLIRSLAAERAGFADFMQRYFTDDGDGNGVLTSPAAVAAFSSDYPYPDESPTSKEAVLAMLVSPVAVSLVANRRAQLDEYERLMRFQEACTARPLWDQPPPEAVQREWGAVDRDNTGLRYWPIQILVPALNKASHNAKKTTMRRDATLVAIALELFRRRGGTYPTSLDQLVPAFLPAVPRDAFTGGPMGYVLHDASPVLYSFGTDLDDDHARALPIDGNGVNPCAAWKHPTVVERLKREDPKQIPDGDWILYPPTND